MACIECSYYTKKLMLCTVAILLVSMSVSVNASLYDTANNEFSYS